MPNLDELLRRELPRTIPQSDPDEVLRRLSSRKARRSVVRRIERFGLVVVGIAGTIAGLLGLERVFRSGTTPGTDSSPFPIVPHANGLIAFADGADVFTVAPDGRGRERIDAPKGAWHPS